MPRPASAACSGSRTGHVPDVNAARHRRSLRRAHVHRLGQPRRAPPVGALHPGRRGVRRAHAQRRARRRGEERGAHGRQGRARPRHPRLAHPPLARPAERFVEIMRWHSYHVLAMAVQDEHEGFFRAVADLVPLASDQGPLTIPAYLGRRVARRGPPRRPLSHRAGIRQPVLRPLRRPRHPRLRRQRALRRALPRDATRRPSPSASASRASTSPGPRPSSSPSPTRTRTATASATSRPRTRSSSRTCAASPR